MKMEAHQQDGNVGGIKRKRKPSFEGLEPYAICTFCDVCFARYNIISKVSVDNGMCNYVLCGFMGMCSEL
ncbi:Uncharacterized protein TCM_039291 [Theobroma cacao]|uniref:Uncharacterized protein n=1 Tax=Theobroma cacao TaxID=3641 RepID=A0A061GRX8_THECC|nr:Uncharacterized protein TCM_039291 [Theobroma cacao]